MVRTISHITAWSTTRKKRTSASLTRSRPNVARQDLTLSFLEFPEGGASPDGRGNARQKIYEDDAGAV